MINTQSLMTLQILQCGDSVEATEVLPREEDASH